MYICISPHQFSKCSGAKGSIFQRMLVQYPGVQFNMKMLFYLYMNSHHKFNSFIFIMGISWLDSIFILNQAADVLHSCKLHFHNDWKYDYDL